MYQPQNIVNRWVLNDNETLENITPSQWRNLNTRHQHRNLPRRLSIRSHLHPAPTTSVVNQTRVFQTYQRWSWKASWTVKTPSTPSICMLYHSLHTVSQYSTLQWLNWRLLMLQKHHSKYIQSDVTRLYLPRRNGDRINILDYYKKRDHQLRCLSSKKRRKILKMASEWQTTRGEKSIHQNHQDTVKTLEKTSRKKKPSFHPVVPTSTSNNRREKQS